jgi:hypothetical protein
MGGEFAILACCSIAATGLLLLVVLPGRWG